MTNTTRDAVYALAQRLGANGMTLASSIGRVPTQGVVDAAQPWVVMRSPPGRSYMLRPYGEGASPTRLPRDLPPTWPARRRPTVAEMLIAAGGLHRFVARLNIAHGATDISADVVACAP